MGIRFKKSKSGDTKYSYKVSEETLVCVDEPA